MSNTSNNNKKGIVSPFFSLILFDLLLILTPFVMLQNYLQEAVHSLSHLSFNLFGQDMPFVLTFVFMLFIIYLTWVRRKITPFRIAVFLCLILIFAIAQNSTDYYMNNKFYDLQHNWHYLAYATFVLVMYRYLKPRNYPPEKFILLTVVKGFLISAFDEGIQVFISSRIFDISDIAKDLMGIMMGLLTLYFLVEQGKIIKNGWRVRQKNISDYKKAPFSILVFLLILVYCLLVFSSLLASARFWLHVFVITTVAFHIIFIMIHLSQKKIFKYGLIGFFALSIIAQSFFFFSYEDENITYTSPALTVYKGIPLFYFDYMIFPNGLIRPVDKKSSYFGGDIANFLSHKADILLFGVGKKVDGAHGFPGSKYVQYPHFIYNPNTKKGNQVIVLPNSEACKEFNRLKREGKNVLFVIHHYAGE